MIGGVAVLGGGACVVIGGLVYLGAQAVAEAEGPLADPSLGPGASTANPSTSSTAFEPSPLPPEMDDEDTDDNSLAGADDDQAGSDEGDDSALGDPSVAGKGASSSGASASAPKKAATQWSCTATGWVRVCGFANVCNNQMVSGIGWGADRFFAQTMAKNACENMARAKGGSTVCTVSCSPKAG